MPGYALVVLYGRTRECAAIDRVIDDAREGRGGGLVVHGDAGVGKTALLQHALAQAPDVQVLRAVGVETESQLAFAALHQLLRPVLHHIARLPAPQAAALGAALGLTAGVHDRFLVSVATMTLLADVAEEQPVLCVVDDTQWLDQESLDALLFAGRRLEAERVALIYATRDVPERRFEPTDLPSLHIAGLPVDAARALLDAHHPDRLAAPVADRLVALTRGNPLGLLELPTRLSADQRAGSDPLPDPLPVTARIEQAFVAQVRRMPAATQTALLVAAADDLGATSTVLRASATLGCPADALGPAESAALLHVDGDLLTFRHPLIRSAVYGTATFAQRRAVHQALADGLHPDADTDRRAWHRAAATVGTDEDVAAELERSADRARARGGEAAAAAALERAAELSPVMEVRQRRLVAAAAAAWTAGLPDRSIGLLDGLAAPVEDPRIGADVAHLRGVLERHNGTMSRAYAILVGGANAVATVDRQRTAAMLAEAGVAGWDANRPEWMRDVSDALRALPLPDDSPAAFAIGFIEGLAGLQQGDTGRAAPRIAQAISHARRMDQPLPLTWAAAAAMFIGDDETSRDLFGQAATQARAQGKASVLAAMLGPYAALEAWTGHFRPAIANATESLRLGEDTRQGNYAALDRALLSWVYAVEGRDADSHAQADLALSTAHTHDMAAAAAIATWALALTELCAGRHPAAHALFTQIREPGGRRGHPSVAIFATGDIVEAAVRADAPAQARDALEVLERFAAHTRPRWALAVAERCRALLCDDPDAAAHFEAALDLHRGATRPFEHGRTALLYGEWLRRDRQPTRARDHLRAAGEILGGLGAAPWEERARGELRAAGETPRRRTTNAVTDLTPQELQIVRFVAQGATNKEVAAQLFLSPRTVEYHLRKVFVKLDVTSRSELIRMDLDS